MAIDVMKATGEVLMSLSLSLRRLTKAIAFSLACALPVSAASYMVPQTYDNMHNASQSFQYGVIKQSTPTMSSVGYTIGGSAANYRCLVVPKITCRSSPGVNLSAAVSEVSLRDPDSNEQLHVFVADMRIEEDAGNFYLCGAAYGGVMFDDFTMSSSGSNLSYDYKANVNLRAFQYFTSTANASTTSYMTVQFNQTCQ